MKDKYIIVHTPNTLKEGEQCPIVGKFDTYDEVMDHYDKVLMVEDPDGVIRGNYTIDEPDVTEETE